MFPTGKESPSRTGDRRTDPFPLSSSILIDYPLFLLNRCWDSRFARKGEKNARETMAIVSRAVTTSPFTPRFGKPTHS